MTPAATYSSNSMNKKRPGNVGNKGSERKKAIDAALGKYLDESSSGDHGEFQIISSSGHHRGPASPRKVSVSTSGTSGTTSGAGSLGSPRPIKKRPSAVGGGASGVAASAPRRNNSRKDELGSSEHSSMSRSRPSGNTSKRTSRTTRSSMGEDVLGTSDHSKRRSTSARPGGARRGRDQLSASEHTGSSSRATSKNTGENDDLNGLLKRMNGHSKPQKKGAGSVASMPADRTRPNSRGRSSRSATRTATVDEEFGEEALKDDDASASGASTRGSRGRSVRSGRKKTDRERESSPGPMKKRADSPGPMKKRSASPGPIKKRSGSVGPVTRKRAESPGPLKKRSQSPGALSRRKGESQNMRSGRVSRPGDSGGGLGSMLGQVGGTNPQKKGARSVASAPVHDLKQPVRRPSFGPIDKQRSIRRPTKSEEGRSHPPARAKSVDYDWQGFRPSKEKLNSNDSTADGSSKSGSGAKTPSSAAPDRRAAMSKLKRSFSAAPGTQRAPASSPRKNEDTQNDLAKQKVKRNNSMAVGSSASGTNDNEGKGDNAMQRAQSMLLHREMTRRGKSNSLADLVQYKEEEIHSTSYFASNHVLINRERMKRGLRPLTRNIAMDELARKSAESMATSNGLNPLKTTYVGNVLRGESIRAIHRSTMQQKQGRERANLLNPYFQDFGVGTCKGSDGQLYMCQLFSERLELALTDTIPSP